MTTLHCSQKLLKRLRRPAQLPEPPSSDNPLGAWCADIEFFDRQPFALLMNAATGLVLVVMARAENLKCMHVRAADQLSWLLEKCQIDGPLAQAEVDALQVPFTFARNSNRSLVASMNHLKFEAWLQFAEHTNNTYEVAARLLGRPFSRKDLPGGGYMGFHNTPDLLRQHLRPITKILPLRVSSTTH